MKLINIEHPDNQEYYEIVKDIINSNEFQRRKEYKHHGTQSVYEHSLKISIISYKLAKILGINYKNCAISGLLHDFYNNPWQDKNKKTTFLKMHGFVHASEALQNSKKYFPQYMNKRIENTILRHMFPLNIIPPKYIEGWIITIVDKYVSMEIFNNPSKLLMYVGINQK
ncbi:MAG: HD domain-containing protein [Clostridium sp.]|nr:HD domain-containing protein [Clostridium sp.]MCM1443764.1 HD domain-containing protein [Candidatus Amulumruptor caecigallinarius]